MANAAASQPDDYVIATGETHSVREFCQLAFAEADLDYRDYVTVDERFYRPAEVDLLIGDASKARRVLAGNRRSRFGNWSRKWPGKISGKSRVTPHSLCSKSSESADRYVVRHEAGDC